MDIQLGLCDPPDPIYLYVGQGEENGQSYLWYRYDIDAQQQCPVFQRGLTGCLSEIRITTKEYKGKDNHKLDVVMRSHRIYIIRSGIETNFTKTLLLALEAADITKPLTIAVAPGEETVVFARVYDAATGARIKAEWNPQARWLNIVAQLSERLVGKANSEESRDVEKKQEIQSHITDTRINRNKRSVHLYSNPSRAVKNDQEKTDTVDLQQHQSQQLYPKHNAIIKAIRSRTGHTPDQIKLWLEQYNATSPEQVDPAICRQLVDALTLSWGESHFRTPEHCQTSYRGKVETLLASGMNLEDAVLVWIDSVTAAPAPSTK